MFSKKVLNASAWCVCLILLFEVGGNHLAWCQTPQATPVPSSFSTEQTPHNPPENPSELSLFEPIPIVVTAAKKFERITQAASIISIITEDDIERMGAQTIADVLKIIPGFEIIKDVKNISQIAARGFRSEASSGIKILIDGHVLNDLATGGPTAFYDDLPLKNVRQIEIIRGPVSALYGSNSFVSVINIITKNAQDINGLQVSVGAGSFGTYNPSFLFGKLINDLEIMAYADYVHTDGAALPVAADTLSLYDEATSLLGITPISLAPGDFQEHREKLYAAAKLTYHNWTFRTGALLKHRSPFLTLFYALNDDSREDTQHVYADLQYRNFFTQRIQFSGRVYADVFRIETIERIAPGQTFYEGENGNLQADDLPRGLFEEYYTHSWRIGVENQLNIRLFEHNDLTVGAACEYIAVDDNWLKTNLLNPEQEPLSSEKKIQHTSFQQVFAVFLQDKWNIKRTIDLTLGLRGDYYSDFGGIVTPKIGVTWEPTPTFNVKFLTGSAFSVPPISESFNELLTQSMQGNASGSGNEPKESRDFTAKGLWTSEIGIGYKPFEWLVAETNYFTTRIGTLHTSDKSIFQDPFSEIRDGEGDLGDTTIQGVEVELRGNSKQEFGLRILPDIIHTVFRINYSYQDIHDLKTQEDVPMMASHKGNIGLGFTLSTVKSPRSRFDAWKIFRTVSNKFSVYFHWFFCGERQRGTGDPRPPLPAFHTLDMTITAQDVFRKRLNASFSIKNMFDADDRSPSPYIFGGDDADNFSTVLDDIPHPGRAFFFELRYKF